MAHQQPQVASSVSPGAPLQIAASMTQQFKEAAPSLQLPRIASVVSQVPKVNPSLNPVIPAANPGTLSISSTGEPTSKSVSTASAASKHGHMPLAGQTLAAQVAMLKSQAPAGSSNPILIKTTRGGEDGTYVAITIPPHSTASSGQRNVIPLTIHQLKVKPAISSSGDESAQQQKSFTANSALAFPAKTNSSSISGSSLVIQRTGGYPTAGEDHGYGVAANEHHSSSGTTGMSSNFPYNDSAALYSQSSVPSYMDGPHGTHHPSAGSQIYPSYPSQAGHPGHPGVVGVGISPQAIGVAQQAQYLQPGQAANQRVPISHTTRASPITVQWLLENYETADGVSLPRSTLYNHYLRHCADSKIDAVNAASFGKLIRSVFLGLKTRRLGTRGNSKYHYYGIRVKPNSPLARLTDDTQVALRAQPSATKRSVTSNSYSGSRPSSAHGEPTSTGEAHDSASHSSHRQYLGDLSEGLPKIPVLDMSETLPESVTRQDATNFSTLYRHHCEALLEVVSNLQFELVESLWQVFWKSPAAANKSDNVTFHTADLHFEKNQLVAICRYRPVQKFVRETDYVLYQKLVDVLVPSVLRAVPSSLTQAIRNFAKSLENILIGSMSEMPKEIVNVKVAAVSAFSQTLRRYTSLNHLAQAARAVLQNPQQINQMWTDLNKVDFTNVQEQSSWVCQCDEALIQRLEQDFKQTLGQQQSLEQWAQWLENVVALVLDEHDGRDSYPKAARQFLLNWSFYSSMIIRDLTLRSAASFGSFHLIRLLYDEYMFYLIEHKVAAHTGKSPLAVMAECVGLSSLNHADNFNGSLNDEDDDENESPDEEDDATSNMLSASHATQSILMTSATSAASSDQMIDAAFGEPEMKKLKTEYMS